MSQPSADEARQAAREILSEPRFGERGGSSFLDDILDGVAGPVRDVLEWISDLPLDGSIDLGVPIPIGVLWVAGLALLLAAGLRARRRRAAAEGSPDGSRVRRRGQAGPSELELEADRAEREGDLSAAFLLRFRAGLLRLSEAGALELRASTTPRDIASVLRSADMDWIVERFEAIAYGGRPATSADASGARERWSAVRSSTARR